MKIILEPTAAELAAYGSQADLYLDISDALEENGVLAALGITAEQLSLWLIDPSVSDGLREAVCTPGNPIPRLHTLGILP